MHITPMLELKAAGVWGQGCVVWVSIRYHTHRPVVGLHTHCISYPVFEGEANYTICAHWRLHIQFTVCIIFP